jgi:hypothetical protein
VDVQPPHQPIRSLKDFFVHLLTITVGLFIALTLEAAVESLHHRHLVRVARENLRIEITNNQRLYADNSQSLKSNRDQLARDIDQLQDLRDGKKLDQSNLGWAWNGIHTMTRNGKPHVTAARCPIWIPIRLPRTPQSIANRNTLIQQRSPSEVKKPEQAPHSRLQRILQS